MSAVKIKYNYSKLQGKIKEVYSTQDEFAKALGIGRVSLSKRLHNKLEFTQVEMSKAVKLLNLNYEEMQSYFFDVEEKNDTNISM